MTRDHTKGHDIIIQISLGVGEEREEREVWGEFLPIFCIKKHTFLEIFY